MEINANTILLERLLLEVNALAIRLRQGWGQLGSSELAGGARSTLQIIGRYGPQAVPEIARNRCTSRQNIQTVVNRLKREGYLEFATNPAHRRSALVRLTESGADLLRRFEQGKGKFLNGLSAPIPMEELESAAIALR